MSWLDIAKSAARAASLTVGALLVLAVLAAVVGCAPVTPDVPPVEVVKPSDSKFTTWVCSQEPEPSGLVECHKLPQPLNPDAESSDEPAE